MFVPFRFAICNELFKGWRLEDVCAAISAEGYTGLEIAPFTLAKNALELSAAEREQVRATLGKYNLSFVGLHWLLASPEGLHATSADRRLREITWAFLDGLIDLAADLASGESTLLVFGSPKQRRTSEGVSSEVASEMMADGLARLAKHAENRNVCVLLEPLSRDQCDVVTSTEEAVRIVKQIGSPAVQTMYDVHNAVDEEPPHSDLIRHFFPYIRHIHVNEVDGREPGTGTYNFGALLSTLSDLNYRGWTSLEAFDFERDPLSIARASLAHLKSVSSHHSLAQTL